MRKEQETFIGALLFGARDRGALCFPGVTTMWRVGVGETACCESGSWWHSSGSCWRHASIPAILACRPRNGAVGHLGLQNKLVAGYRSMLAVGTAIILSQLQ